MGAGEGGRGAGTKMSRGKGLPDDAEAKRRQNNVTTAAGERKGGGAGVGGTRATAKGTRGDHVSELTNQPERRDSVGVKSRNGSDNISGSMRKWIKRVVNVVNGGDGGSGGLVPAGRSGAGDQRRVRESTGLHAGSGEG